MDARTDGFENKKEEQNLNLFEQMLDEYDYERPKRGQVLEGEIIRIDEDAILVDVGLKRDAIVPSKDLSKLDDEFLGKLSVGDLVTVYVIQPPEGDQDLLVSLNKGIEYQYWEEAERHMQAGDLLDLEVIGQNKGGLLVKFKGLRGFLPFSQVPELRRIRDRRRAENIKRDLIGRRVPVKVIEIDRDRQRLIVSAHAAEEEQRQRRLEELEVGQIVYGKVVNIVDFGVFIGLDGVDGLVHISELDHKRVDHPTDVVKLGDEMEVQVIEVDKENERISLSRKTLLPNPWSQIAEKFTTGESVEGRVTKVLDFGAFVELMEGVEGLIHVSELGYSSAEKLDPREMVKPDEEVLVRILDIEPERERISLSMRQVPLERQIGWTMERPVNEEPPSEGQEATSEKVEPDTQTLE